MDARNKQDNSSYQIYSSAIDKAVSLRVSGINFSKTGIAELRQCLQDNPVVELEFRDCKFTGKEFIRVLEKSVTLKRLDIANNPLTFDQAISLLALGKHLTHLNMSNTADFYDRYVDMRKPGNQSIDVCPEIAALNKKTLEIHQGENELYKKKQQQTSGIWSLFSTPAEQDAQTTTQKMMEIFNAQSRTAEDHCVAFWKEAGSMLALTKTLQVLDLSDNISMSKGPELAHACMQAFAPGLAANRTLNSLALRHNVLRHHSLTSVADALKQNSNIPLETLDLGNNHFQCIDNPAGSLPQLLAQPGCQIKTLILSQETPFSLLEICEEIAKNPTSQMSLLVAEFSKPEGRDYHAVIKQSDQAVNDLIARNNGITVNTNKPTEASRISCSK